MEYTEQEEKLKEEAAEKTRVYYTPLISSNRDIKKIEIGTGIFVTFQCKFGILTNDHVADIFKKKSTISIPNRNTENGDLINLSFSNIISSSNMTLSNNDNEIDMAFIQLDDEGVCVVDQIGKQFLDLDSSALEWEKNKWHNIKKCLWVIHGAVVEGYKFRLKDNCEHMFYKNAGPYIVVPDLENIKKNGRFGSTKGLDEITCPIKTERRTPKSFEGMSGGAMWQVIFNENWEICQILLRGIATEYGPAKKAEKLICRGPVTIYNLFYPFCVNYFKQTGLERK